MDILLIVLLLLILFGGVYGFRQPGYWPEHSLVGVLLLVLFVFLIIALLAPPWPYHRVLW